MDRLVTDNQFDDFRNVGQFVIAKIVEWSKETRIEEEGFKENAGYFLFKGATIEVDFIDNFSFSLQVGISVSPFKDFFDFSLSIQGRKDRRIGFCVDRFHKLDVVEDGFFVGSTDVLA